MSAFEISQFVGVGYVYVNMPTNIVMYGEFIPENQKSFLQHVNIWVFTVGNDSAQLEGNTIIKINK